ncbi:MAG: ATP-grasp domain-containing protein [bacterium]|nr:ATP-grasp domain-containing protein [bacterium]
MANHIPTPGFSLIRERADGKEIKALGTPLIFKPYKEGSSVGVKKFNTFEELEADMDRLLGLYRYGIVERFLHGKNITVGVLEDRKGMTALPALELVPENEFYDYEAKYTAGKTKFILPARLDEEVVIRARDLALRAHQVLWCYGVSRVDMIVAERDIYVLEVNTIPGMTQTSDLPAEAKAMGIEFDDLVERILISGYEQYGNK